MSRELLLAAVCSIMITLAGCGGSGDSGGDTGSDSGDQQTESETTEETSSSSSAPSSVEKPGDNWAELSGTVTVKGEKPAPKTQTQNLSACKMSNGEDGKLKIPVADFGENGGIKNVFVWVEPVEGEMTKLTSELPQDSVTVDQEGCEFFPDSAIVSTGGKVTVTNSDAGSHNFSYSGDFWSGNINQEKGQEDSITDVPDSPQFVTYECNIHPWMGGLLRVAEHHAYALSSKDGSFNIGHVAPGEYTVKVHHKSLSDPVEKGTITVKEDGSVEGLDLSGLQLEIEG